jgi:UDP-N-acetylmuramate dehydrogenase
MSDSGYDLRSLTWKLRQVVGEENVLLNEPMSKHTTFQIGGPTDIFVIPDDVEEVEDILEITRAAGAPFFVLGCGSDLLVADEGFRGVIIDLADGLLSVGYDGYRMTCQAGVPLKEASEMACELGLSGLEFACGIPGSVGGACFMNAGAYGGCMSDVLESIRVITSLGEQRTIPVEDLNLGYRTSLVRTENLVVLEATFELHRGKSDAIRVNMDELNARREEKQPLELPSAGSTFKRPEGHYAGKLISDAGLQGYRVGGAAVSNKHAGFVVNLGGATASDVHAVIEHVQKEVERKFGIQLEPEVRFLP